VLVKLSALIEVKRREEEREQLSAALRRLHCLWQDETWSLELRAVALLLADLFDHGWDITAEDDSIHLQPPGLRLVGETAEQAKERMRRALQTGRNRQLADPGVQKFLSRMHRVVPRGGGRSSIADVVDDGPALAASLQPFTGLPSMEAADRLKSVIDPVIEVCDEDAKCSVTGLRLIDIWRYFRHTWSLEYRPTPGRQMAILIRNVARPKRPVIGIAMLASPVVRMRVRDDWIGWNPEAFIERLRQGTWGYELALRALVSRIERSIADIRWDDLVSPDELAFPSERCILRLEQRSAGAALTRQRQLETAYDEAEQANESVRSQRDLAKTDPESMDWQAASEDPLFFRKRAETLGQLLDAKRTFQSLNWTRGGRALIDALMRHANGLRTLSTALAEVRKGGLSSQVADVSVCGAVAPYSSLLGGKLVALLMASQEVRDAYRSRYADQVSVISSQMAGRAIYRPAELKLLTTTSLYGNGSSQYNRLRLRAADFPVLDHDLAWQELDKKTAGYGTVHLGPTTVHVLREFSERLYRSRRINHRFGEGASPRLRQIREAVEALGIDAAAVLHHATPRIIYGCELHPGAIDELIGLYPATENRGHPVSVIGSLWRQRWLSRRIQSHDVLSSVARGNAQALVDFFSEAARRASGATEDVGSLLQSNSGE
jgi:Druantia protein DruA